SVVSIAFWDLVHRKPAIKTGFNSAQYLLSIVAAGSLLGSLTGVPHEHVPLHPAELPPIFLAAFVMIVVNQGCSGTVTALAMGAPVWSHTRREMSTAGLWEVVGFGFSPIVAVAVSFSPWMLPLLTLPFLAIYYSARQADLREHDAMHDQLTGLANRSLFRARLGQELERDRFTRAGVGVLILDIDHFKDVNDTLGHSDADALLNGIAARVQKAAAPGDLVARLGGDEFGVLVTDVPGSGVLRALAVRIRSLLDDPFVIAGLRLGVTPSIGIAWAPQHGHDADALLRRADVAMYRAKLQRTSVEVYDPSSDPYSPERLVLAAQLRDGIARGELVLHYQPKLSIATGQVVGVEALVRWRHPTRGLMPPGEFIELAERTDVIGALTMSVLRTAIGQMASWRRVGIEVPVAVNLPAQMLLDRDLPSDVASLLARHGLDAGNLVLEITEGSLIHDPHGSAQILDALDEMGVRIAIDDFGTGYSSLAWLKRFPVREIKVDRSFVTDLAANESDAAIVRSTIELGRALGLTVVAEGVETADVLELLAGYGCDVAQGFLISRPVPAAQLVTWLRARDRVSGVGPRVSGTVDSA
ncbi:MAG TPA: EAL domain-containing protein, partial [Candidatus Dormibacteraeota bacterium]|nr:EAL domain-containing protein [Candidatus Dormibacteraeota bacterium]